MPKNILTVTEQQLAAVPLPNHGGKYTPVGHKFIIDEVHSQLQANNLTLKSEHYTQNLNGEVAQGVYHLEYGTDSELSLMFAWTNSYDKTLRFRCAVGAHIKSNSSGMIAGDMSNYGRKHTGDAKSEVVNHIQSQLKNVAKYFTDLIADKEMMKKVDVSYEEVAELCGLLYFKEDVITSSQLIKIKESYKHMNTDQYAPRALWSIYNYMTLSLKSAHPKVWMEQQKSLHKIIVNKFSPPETYVDPNQTILEVEFEQEPTPEAVLGAITGVTITEAEVTEAVKTEEFTQAVEEEPVSFSLDDYEADTTEPVPEVEPEAQPEKVDETEHLTSTEANTERLEESIEQVTSEPKKLSLDLSNQIHEDDLPKAPPELPVSGPNMSTLAQMEDEEVKTEVVEQTIEEQLLANQEEIVDEVETEVPASVESTDFSFETESDSKTTALESPDFEF